MCHGLRALKQYIKPEVSDGEAPTSVFEHHESLAPVPLIFFYFYFYKRCVHRRAEQAPQTCTTGLVEKSRVDPKSFEEATTLCRVWISFISRQNLENETAEILLSAAKKEKKKKPSGRRLIRKSDSRKQAQQSPRPENKSLRLSSEAVVGPTTALHNRSICGQTWLDISSLIAQTVSLSAPETDWVIYLRAGWTKRDRGRERRYSSILRATYFRMPPCL